MLKANYSFLHGQLEIEFILLYGCLLKLSGVWERMLLIGPQFKMLIEHFFPTGSSHLQFLL